MTRRSEHDAEDLTRRINTVGAEAAYQALLEVCQDKKAPAPARATAGTSLLRAAGRFDKDRYRTLDKPPHEMTGEELAARIEKLRSERERLQAGFQSSLENDHQDDDQEDDKPNDLFG